MTNTEYLYTKAKQFQDKRAALITAHEKKLQGLERFKGSKGYEEDLEAENKRLETSLKELQDECRSGLYEALGFMMNAIGRRSVKAPTNDQVNLLNVLKMKKKVTLEECQRIAESVKDNPIAVSVVTEIAHEHGIMNTFEYLCPEMSSERASEIVMGMRNSIEDFLKYDTTKASRIVKQFHEDHYGATSEGDLVKRKLFTDQEGFYRDEIGIEGTDMSQFSGIVDA